MKLSKIILSLLVMVSTTQWLYADNDEDSHDRSRQNFSMRELSPLTENRLWKSECSSCHQLYHPGLLPERSWKKMMKDLENHFGENASLDIKTQKEIESFLTANASDHSPSRRSMKFNNAISPLETPLRVSETAYFKRKHDEVNPKVFKRKSIGSAANCLACHKNAEKGYFAEHEVKIPKQ